MKLSNDFTVPAPVERAWEVLLDVERVAPCLPGASLEGEQDGEYAGTMKIKIGPITTSYKGTVKIEEADEAGRRAVMRAQARDSRGQGTAAATITSTMEEVEGGTRVHVETDMRVTGPAAQFGRGVMQDVSAKLMGRFADCLAAEMAGAGATAAPPAAEEAGGAATATSPAAETPSAPAPDGARVVGPLNPAADPPPGPAGESAEAAASGAAARPRPSEEVLDLGEASREAVLKRVAPVAAVLLGLIVILGIRRRR
ncbi:MAG TPA: SRPBCC family protein [Solirubrobacteraceae bacterium]|nr:SRPBCC family protein [Solirubrobacteraceae bacterium]